MDTLNVIKDLKLFKRAHGFWESVLDKTIDPNDIEFVNTCTCGEFKSEMQNSIPQKEKFVRISSISNVNDDYYNFKFKTPNQEAYLGIYNVMSNINDLWAFLEDICEDDFENTAFYTNREGPESILVAEKVDEENIRFTLLNNSWDEHSFNNKDAKWYLKIKSHPNFKMHVNMDIIINRRDFIYTFYLELYYIFCNIEVSDKNIITDSKIIRKYLGYVPATKKDLELEKLFTEGNLEKIEKALKDGANPNAIKEIEEGTGDIFLVTDELYSMDYVDANYTHLIWNKDLTDEESDELEKKLEPYKSELIKHNFEIIQLVFKYGAKPISLFPFAYAYYYDKFNILEYCLDNNCKFDMRTIECIVSDINVYDLPEYQDIRREFEQYDKMFDDYLFDVSHQIDYFPEYKN